MDLGALQLSILLILAEFTVGSLATVLIMDARHAVPAGFVKLSSAIVAAGAALTVLAAFNADSTELQDYRLQGGLFGPVRGTFLVFVALAVPYAWVTLQGRREASLRWGAIALAAGVAGLGMMAYQVSLPTWGFAGVLISLLAGSLALGLVTESLIMGHWYLVRPKLPGRPLRELTLLLFAALALQAVLLAVNAVIPAREVPESTAAIAGGLASNPAFWLRVGVGMVFPLSLAFMAWQSSKEHAMMSATGLLYIAVGAVFVGELLARGLLFVTASPV